MSRFAVLDFEYRELSDFVSRLSSALLHIQKDLSGYLGPESVGDEEIKNDIELLAEVLATTKGMMVASDAETFRHEVQKEVIPTSVYFSFRDRWDKDIDEWIERVDRMITRLRDPDIEVQMEDLEIVEEVLRVSSSLLTDVYQEMHGIR